MQTNLLWTGREYYSLENCILTRRETGSEVNSVIIGMYDHKIYRVEYLIKANENWKTIFLELKTQLADNRESFSIHSDGKGNWTKSGEPVHELNSCIDYGEPHC